MKTQLSIVVLVALFVAPAIAQSRFGAGYDTNGRHIGPYANGGNPYSQPGGGIAPIYRNPDGSSLTPSQPTTLPPLEGVPKYAQNQPTDGHSLQYQLYKDSQPVSPPVYNTQPVQPQPVQPQQQPFTYNPPPSAPVPALPTARSTIYEIVDILKFQPMEKKFDYLSWYLNGAQIDPKTVLKENMDWTEDLLRHFVSDFLIAFWNVTMQDAFLRILMPLLIVAAVFKTGEMSMQRLLR
jgi:hypothetical protein